MRDQYEPDPYAPPPRHKEKSGAVVRFAILAALLGVAAWGYTEFANQPQTPLVAEEEMPQQMAENQIPAAVAPPAATSESAPATPQSAPSTRQPAPDLPPPTTTQDPPAG